MPRKMQTNSFEKGMNKSLTKDRIPATSYRDALNFRLSDDDEKSAGALVNVKGNSLEFNIPQSPSCWVLKPIPNTEEPSPGTTDDLVVLTSTGSVTINLTVSSGGFSDLFNQIMDETGPGSNLYLLGVRTIRTSAKSIAFYSNTVEITSVNVGTSVWTYGTKLASIQKNLEVIGWSELRDSIILFTTNNSTQSGGNGQIWFVKYDKATDTYTPEIRYTCDSLNFTKWHPIEAVARYENELTQRVYWTDNFNKVRSLNIASINTSMGVDPNFLNLEPAITFSKPVIQKIGSGGSLQAGVYQYAYRLSSVTGAQTKFSPASNLLNIVEFAENGVEWDMDGEYNGTAPGTATTKTVTIKIKDLDAVYDTIDIIYLYYGSLTAPPEIFQFESTGIPTNGEVTIVHSGAETPILISETEYKSFGIPFEIAKTISYQDNRLLVGNIKAAANEDLIFHSRAYRFGDIKRAVNTDGYSNYPAPVGTPGVPFNDQNSYSLLDNTGTPVNTDIRSYIPGLNIDDADWGYKDPEDENISTLVRDAINPYNRPDWLKGKHLPFKFQTDGRTLGGEGPYIKYEFTFLNDVNVPFESYDQNNYQTTAPLLSSNKPTITYDFNTNGELYTSTNTPKSHKSPYLNNTARGYMTGEIYRFGIVLYDKSGNPGFVNWIGDIKFPERWEIRANIEIPGTGSSPNGEISSVTSQPGYPGIDLVGNVDDQNGDPNLDIASSTYFLNQMGIKFTITIPDDIIENVSGYEIVRVKRGSGDKTKLTQGVADILAFPEHEDDDTLYVLPGKGYVSNANGSSADTWKWDVPAGTEGLGLGYQQEPLSAAPKRSLIVYSPEFQFKDDIGFSSGDRLRIEGRYKFWEKRFSPYPTELSPIGIPTFPPGPENLRVYSYGEYLSSTGSTGGDDGRFLKAISPDYGDEQNSAGKYMSCNSRKTIEVNFAREVEPGEQISAIPTNGFTGIKFINASIPKDSYNKNAGQPQADHCRSIFLTLNTVGESMDIDADSGTGFNESRLLVTYEREVSEQYGGNTQEARSNNFYIKTAGFISIRDITQPTTAFDVFGGDTYHLEYDFTRLDGKEPINYTGFPAGPVGYPGINKTDASRDGIVVPLLTSLNTSLRTGRHLLNKMDLGIYPPATDELFQFDEYLLEDVYNREQDYIFFPGRPAGIIYPDEFDNRVHASQAKINGETIDQWRQWNIGTYIDVEGSLGPINKLISYSNQNFFFQDHGCGFLLINPSASVSTSGGGALQLGFGGVLYDFTYISTEIGCFHQWMPVTTNDNLFFIDIYAKQMYSIKGQTLLPVSLAGGLSPWFSDNLNEIILTSDNPILTQGITSTWDRRFNEIWVTLNNLNLIVLCENAAFDIFQFKPGFLGFALRISSNCIDPSDVSIGMIVQFTLNNELVQFTILDVGSDAANTYLRIEYLPSPYTQYNNALEYDAEGNITGLQNMTVEGVASYNFITNTLSSKAPDVIPVTTIPGEYTIDIINIYKNVQQTIVYNEAYDIYTGFYSHTPPIYINDGTHILSPNPLARKSLFKHNSGAYGEFYDNLYKSSLELAINDSKGITKVFDNISYHSEVWSNDGGPARNITLETFDSIRFYTDFQNTDWVSIDLSADIAKRVEREWQLDVSRNAVSQLVGPDVDIFDASNLDPSAKFKNRLRDKTMTINLELNNSNNRRFLLNYFKTFYRFSIR